MGSDPIATVAEGRMQHEDALVGNVFDIKRFALHDGPGIRTTAFLKGCPLACVWCQNPEGIPVQRTVVFRPEECIRCERCVSACPRGAISTSPGARRFIEIDRSRCDCDGSCIAACPSEALRWDSSEYTVEALVEALCRDRVFYEQSGGGVTLSGGEPLHQREFAERVLRRCKEEGLHTALESTLHTSKRVLTDIAPYVDLFLADIKLWDSDEHMRYTGQHNSKIVENIRFLAEEGMNVLIRIPLIPETTTAAGNISSIAAFVRSLPGDIRVELINFNPLAAGKYEMLQKEYPYSEYTSSLPDEEVERFAELVRAEGVSLVGE